MIGLFDSGMGGLSVLRALYDRAPGADVVYFGDIANMPYGSKSPQELKALARQGIAILKVMRAHEIIAACNSVSPAILSDAAQDIPIIEMTIPTARGLQTRKHERMLLIATPATIYSGIYQASLHGQELDVLAIPDLASAIESGTPEGDIVRIVDEALKEKKGEAYQALILGCTQYPLVREIIEREAQKYIGRVELIDPAQFVAAEAAERFDTQGSGKLHFRISKNSDHFRSRCDELFPHISKTIDVV